RPDARRTITLSIQASPCYIGVGAGCEFGRGLPHGLAVQHHAVRWPPNGFDSHEVRMRVVSTAGTLAALIGFTLPNEAQTPAKRYQFGLDGTLIAAESGTLTLEGNEFDYTATQGGIASGLGMTLGSGLTDSLVLNTRLVQSSGTTRLESDAS